MLSSEKMNVPYGSGNGQLRLFMPLGDNLERTHGHSTGESTEGHGPQAVLWTKCSHPRRQAATQRAHGNDNRDRRLEVES